MKTIQAIGWMPLELVVIGTGSIKTVLFLILIAMDMQIKGFLRGKLFVYMGTCIYLGMSFGSCLFLFCL